MKNFNLTIFLIFIAGFGFSQSSGIPYIKVDQFGYLPNQEKVAVLSNPQTGFNSSDSYTPGSTIQVLDAKKNEVAYSGSPQAWKSGNTHVQSGDKVWWFDFSNLTKNGEYYIYDPDNAIQSYNFTIGEDVYKDALRQSMRTFFYQRCGMAKSTPYAEACWSDGVCHHGIQQDLDCRLVTNPVVSTSLDLSGGWHDAGDYNKYINYAAPAVHDLLFAYENYPDIWKEDFYIPESGNEIPDILDEVKYELDWMLKMQLANGSVLHKVSAINWDDAESPPSAEGTVRRYAPATASATISACGVFAHAAIVYQNQADATMQLFGQQLETAAISAWQWLIANPSQIPSNYNNAGFVNADAENAAYTQYAQMVADAAFLLVLTGDADYRTYFDNNYGYCHLFTWSAISYDFDDPWINDGLLYYENAASASAGVVSAIKAKYLEAMNNQYADFAPLYKLNNQTDAYRAFLDIYNWGSNQYKSNAGNYFTSIINYQIDAANNELHATGAANYLQYLHGVNPLAQNYLTNMGSFGAENSVPEFYHVWFADGTDFDNVNTSLYGPAPGFLAGGPNEFYALAGQTLEPPENQPAQKSYLSWNTSDDNSWEITENQIIYQAAYTRLLAHFIGENSGEIPANMLANPGAENGVSPCYSFAGGFAIQQSAVQKHLGNYSFLCANRTQNYHGPAFNVKPLVTGGQLESGQRYTFSVWVWHGETSNKNLQMNLKQVDGGGTNYISLKNVSIPPDTWYKLDANYALNISGTLSGLEMYLISGSGQTFDFYADDFYVGTLENYNPPTSSTSTDFIRASGMQLAVSEANTPIVMNGMNITVPVDSDNTPDDIWDVESISQFDFQNIKALGFNAIRLNMNYVIFEDDDDIGNYKEDGWHWLDRVIAFAKDAGIYVLLDMHAPQGGYQSDKPIGFSAFWDGSGAAPNTANQDRLINLWGAIADRYKHETAIMGYDLINEPRPNNSAEWYSYAEQIIAKIRTYDNHHLIVLEVPFIPNYTNSTVSDNNVLYDSHFYYTWAYVTQYSAAYGNGGDEWGKYDPADPIYVDGNEDVVAQGTPGAVAFDADYLETYLLGDILTFTAANNVPACVGEYGICWEIFQHDLGATQYMRDMFKILNGDNSENTAVSRFYFSYQGNAFGLYHNWTGFQTSENEVSENLKGFFGNDYVWTGSSGTSWEANENWSVDLIPDSTNNVTIPVAANQAIITSNPDAPALCSNLSLLAGATLTIDPGKALTVNGTLSNQGNIDIKSTSAGTGSLIHSTTAISANIERYIQEHTDEIHGWHFLSAPVAGQTISDFQDLSANDDFYKWSEADGEWINRRLENGTLNPDFETNFVLGSAYMMAKESTATPVFNGSINVEDVEISGLTNTAGSSNEGWHLLGNPYASAIKWNNTGGSWSLVNVASNCQIWNEATASYDVLASDDIIPQINGFMVYTPGNGSLTLPASSRVHSEKSWYKSSKNENRLVLRVNDATGETSQSTIIGFNSEANPGFDLDFDSYFVAGFAPGFYSISNGESFALNTVNEISENEIIQLGFVKNSSKDFSLEIIEKMENAHLILFDKKLNIEHNLDTNPVYNFSSDDGDAIERFQVIFKSAGGNDHKMEDKVKISVSFGYIQIKGQAKNSEILIFDTMGKLLVSRKADDDEPINIEFNYAVGIYFVGIRYENSYQGYKIIVLE